ncbi:hypothetical protein EDD16DRAFT_1711819 [Pisolithus croceorrhizus]|nr:hypothetical protein EDD16DRAFT_1711819 [Pisolithus croceorrhizus]KAI6124901.1 hypothetical protein EV401DRAFT_2068620 [Pisolithus croceorrhizus]
MVNELPPGQYYIVSFVKDLYLSVCGDSSPTSPPPPPVPVIVLYEKQEGTKFTVEKTDTYNTYTISAKYANTLGLGDRVFALTNEPGEEWVIRYREYYKAYTIERKYGPRAWTKPPEEPGFDRQVILRPLTFQPSKDGPQYLPWQLFKFVPVDKE